MAFCQVGHQLGVVNVCQWVRGTSHVTFIDDIVGLYFATWAEVRI